LFALEIQSFIENNISDWSRIEEIGRGISFQIELVRGDVVHLLLLLEQQIIISGDGERVRVSSTQAAS
jgi:hypothetical protein